MTAEAIDFNHVLITIALFDGWEEHPVFPGTWKRTSDNGDLEHASSFDYHTNWNSFMDAMHKFSWIAQKNMFTKYEYWRSELVDPVFGYKTPKEPCFILYKAILFHNQQNKSTQ